MLTQSIVGPMEDAKIPQGAELQGQPLPERLGPYRVEGRLGKGGMGEVYRGFDDRLDRAVALKRVKPDANDPDNARKRFQREAKTIAKLSHGSIVQVYDWIEDEDSDWIVMELVEGRSLREILDEGLLALDEAARIAREIASGLGAAHDVGLIHRDLKPENVMLTSGGGVKILDFGLAKQVAAEGMATSDISVQGQIRGTVTHMSPEQATGQKMDHRSDLFALGTLLYQSVTGLLPFKGQNVVETLTQICSSKQQPIAELRLGVPRELTSLIDNLLQKSPARRPPSAAVVIEGLDRALDAIAGSPAAQTSISIIDAMTLQTNEQERVASSGTASIQLKTLLLSDLVDSTKLVYNLGDERSAQVFRRHDQVARELLVIHAGREIDKSDGFLILFDRPIDAVTYSLAYHEALAELSVELGVQLRTRVGIHLGEVVLSENSPEEVARGAKSLEVEGLAKPTAARIMSLARGRQTLMSDGAFHLAREAAADTNLSERELRWLAHGPYLFKGVPDPVDVFEVGLPGISLLEVPPDSEKARRAVAVGDELTLGWRPGPGQAIPRRDGWVLDREIGRGGFGEAWLALHRETDEPRVFKFCHDPEQLRSFQREVTLFRLLKDSLGDHPRIARILDWSFDEAPYYIEAEYVRGGDLIVWAESEGGISGVALDQRLEIVAQIADALAAAHSVGILHKDVKPGNVLIGQDRNGGFQVKLTDFGVAQLLDKRELLARGITVSGMTEDIAASSSSIAGSHIYMAPEVSEGKMATVQADIYAVGVLLYQMVVGELGRALAPSWQRDVDDEILQEDIASFVDGEPQRRPGSAREVANRLRSLKERRQARDLEKRREEEAAATRQALVKAQKRRKLATWTAVAAILVLAVVSVLAVIAVRAQREAERSQEVAVQRRGQAEDLISYMLGDLRTKLEEVGRLPILDDVGEQAMEYFAAVPQAELSSDELARRSKALYQIGEVRIQQGKLAAAMKPLEESLSLAQALVEREPDHGDRLFELGQSEFWVGLVAWEQGRLDKAVHHFESYLSVSEKLVAMDSTNQDWLLELSFAYSNLGSILQARGELEDALSKFESVLEINKSLLEIDPNRDDFRFELAATYNLLGVVQRALGDLVAAGESHGLELTIRKKLADKDPNNKIWWSHLGTTYDYVGNLRKARGHTEESFAHYQAANEIFEKLVLHDPTNSDWRRRLALSKQKLGEAWSLMGEKDLAAAAWLDGLKIAKELAKSDPSNADWQLRLAIAYLDSARAFFDRDLNEALERAREAARRLEEILEEQAQGSSATRKLAESYLLVGTIEERLGNQHQAEQAWQTAIDRIVPLAESSRDDELLAPWATALLFLGEIEKARSIVKMLDGQGYRDRDFVKLCREKGIVHAFLKNGPSIERRSDG